jgi:hypothetical protein
LPQLGQVISQADAGRTQQLAGERYGCGRGEFCRGDRAAVAVHHQADRRAGAADDRRCGSFRLGRSIQCGECGVDATKRSELARTSNAFSDTHWAPKPKGGNALVGLNKQCF